MRPVRPNPWWTRRLELEPRNDSSVLRLLRSTQTRSLQHLWRDAATIWHSANHVCRTLAPATDHKQNKHEPDSQINSGHAPGHQTESGMRRLSVNFRAKLLNEGLRDGIFGIAPTNGL